MSPILVRPVREQLEHDRVIRLLQAKYKRKFEVAINPGNEQTMPVGNAESPWYPDLVLQTSDKARKLAGVVEVETAESVNNLEAMSQWATFAKLRVPFHLYLPTASIDSARRFCAELGIPVAELWAYQSLGDQLRFTLIQRVGPPLEGKKASTTETVSEQKPRAVARPPEPPPAPAVTVRAAAPARARTNGQAPARKPVPRRTPVAAASTRGAAKGAAKTKPKSRTVAPRRAAKAAAARKPKTSPSRAQKRR